MAKKLCVIKDLHEVVEAEEGTVAVFELVGGDYWGCNIEELVHVAGTNGGAMFPAKNLGRDMRVWLDIPALVEANTFWANIS